MLSKILSNKILMAVIILVIISLFFVLHETIGNTKSSASNQKTDESDNNIKIENTYLGNLNTIYSKLIIYNSQNNFFDYDLIQDNDTVLKQKKGKYDSKYKVIYFNTLVEGTENEKEIINLLLSADVSINSINLINIINKNYKFTQLK